MHTHPARTERVNISLPLVLEWDKPGGGRGTTEPAAPRTPLDLAKDIPVTSHIFTLVESIVNNFVAPASDEFPAGATATCSIVFTNALSHGYVKVPRNDEAITTTCIDDTLW